MHPTVDFCFKELMQNENVRKGFLSAVLHVPADLITETTLLPTIMNKKYADSKVGILDVRLKLKDDSQIDIEMQVMPFEWWEARTLFYLCKMYTDQIHEGDSYGRLAKCIHIGILDFVMFPEETGYYSCFQLREKDRGFLYTDQMEIHILELPKLENYDMPEDELLRWAKFFRGKNQADFREMAEKDKYIKEAYKTLETLSADKLKRMEYEAREKAILDYNSLTKGALQQGLKRGIAEGIAKGRAEGIATGRAEGIATGRAEGIATGRAEGIATGRAEGIATGRAEGIATGRTEGELEKTKTVIRNMLSHGMPEEEICVLADCTKEEIDNVRSEINVG